MRRWGEPWQPWTDQQARTYQETIGANLRHRRNTLGLSLDAVETLTGGRIKAGALSAWERGTNGIKPERLSQLARTYDTHISALLPEDTWTLGKDT